MTKAATLTLISDLSVTQTDATAIDRFYDDVVRELGTLDVIMRITLIASVIDQASYSKPAAAIDRKAVFFDNLIMDEMMLQDLMSLNRDWRDEQGEPIAVYTEHETEDSFSLYPLTQTESGSVAGGDFEANFPTYAVSLLHTNYEADLPVWLELHIAFTVLYREFGRESDHRDTNYAEACRQLASILWEALGIPIQSIRRRVQNA